MMKPKMKMKLATDLAMSVILLFLTTYQLFDHELHEWFGVGMLALFLLHTVLNLNWYKNLFKGKYTAYRVVWTVLNFAVLASILCLGYSGIILSRHVFAFLPINGGMALARSMHLAACYWGFVLMSLHLGLHWGMVMGMLKKLCRVKGENRTARLTARILAAAIACFGVYAFVAEQLPLYMFLQADFAFFDYESPAAWVLVKYIAIAVLFVAIGYYGTMPLKKMRKNKENLP